MNFSFKLQPFLVKETDFPAYNRPPLRQDWKIKEILAYISSRFNDRVITIGMFPDCEYFNAGELALYITERKLPYLTNSLFLKEPFGSTIKYCDIVIMKSPLLSHYCREIESSKLYEKKALSLLKQYNFAKIKDYDLPDNSTVAIYEKIAEVSFYPRIKTCINVEK